MGGRGDLPARQRACLPSLEGWEAGNGGRGWWRAGMAGLPAREKAWHAMTVAGLEGQWPLGQAKHGYKAVW